MALLEWTVLVKDIRNKTRGHTGRVQIVKSPSLWAKMGADDEVLVYLYQGARSCGRVAIVRPGDRITFTPNGWASLWTCRIALALRLGSLSVMKNRLWKDGYPCDDTLEFQRQRFTPPEKWLTLEKQIKARCATVTLDDIPPKYRLMQELKTWDPACRVSAKVRAFAQGLIPEDELSTNDLWTVINYAGNVVQRVFEEAAK